MSCFNQFSVSAENHGTAQIFQPACAVAAAHIEVVDDNRVDGLHRADLQTLRTKAADCADDVGALILYAEIEHDMSREVEHGACRELFQNVQPFCIRHVGEINALGSPHC